MKITVKKSTMVKPMEETPSGSLWLSPLDLVYPANYHTSGVKFYRHNGSADFFDTAVLKAALSRALVEFYPFAGRLRKDDDGRLEINCNGLGASFVEAECDAAINDLDDFSLMSDISLVPAVDYSKGLSSFPLTLIQLTRFKCGGICLGFTTDHHLADGVSMFHFRLRWCNIARCGAAAIPIAAAPFLDRRILAPRNLPRPMFNKIEDQQPPSLQTPLNHSGTTSCRTFSLTPNQINSLKQTCKSKYTAFEVVAGHAWRCVTTARQLPKNQQTELQITLDGRQKFQPPLPAGYSGNVLVYTAAVASCGELESNPLGFAVEKVHEAVARVDDEYMRSAVDYCDLAQRSSHGSNIVESKEKCPNLGINSWFQLPTRKMDFGWGKPIYWALGAALPEGKVVLAPHLEKEGTMLLTVGLYEEHMHKFEKLLYMPPIIMSKV